MTDRRPQIKADERRFWYAFRVITAALMVGGFMVFAVYAGGVFR